MHHDDIAMTTVANADEEHRGTGDDDVRRIDGKDTSHAAEQRPNRSRGGPVARAPRRVKVVRFLLRVLCRLLFRVRVDGLEQLPSTHMIVCPNHLNWIDAFLVLLFLPVEPHLYALGDQAAVTHRGWQKRVVDWLDVVILLDRKRPGAAMAEMQRALAGGNSLLIFPEGGPGPSEGTLMPLKTGAARLSLESGVPIVPVGVAGTRETWLGKRLVLRVGAPIDPAPYRRSHRVPREQAHALNDTLSRSILALLPGPENDRPSAGIRPLRRWLTNLFEL